MIEEGMRKIVELETQRHALERLRGTADVAHSPVLLETISANIASLNLEMIEEMAHLKGSYEHPTSRLEEPARSDQEAARPEHAPEGATAS